MLRSPPTNRSLGRDSTLQERAEQDGRDDGGEWTSHHNGQDQPWQLHSARRLSFTVIHDLWLGSWETALAALTTATENGMLSTNEAAAHRAVITTEREVVTRQFTLLRRYTHWAT